MVITFQVEATDAVQSAEVDVFYNAERRAWFWRTDGSAVGPFVQQHDAVESARGTLVLAEMNRRDDAAPKRDRRFLGRHAPLRKGQVR